MQHSPVFSPNNNPASELGCVQKLFLFCTSFACFQKVGAATETQPLKTENRWWSARLGLIAPTQVLVNPSETLSTFAGGRKQRAK